MTRRTCWCLATAGMLGWVWLLTGCGGGPQETATMTGTRVTPDEWQAVATHRIVFGHQSVGRNVLDGVRALAAEAGVQIPINQTREAGPEPGIDHFAVGRNTDPLGKIKDFAAVIDADRANPPDVALMKLCYVDFPPSLDPAQIASAYCDTLDSLARRYPRTTFVAVTAPLTIVQGGLKAAVKRVLGRTPDGYEANARRAVFNEILRQRYADPQQLFDLAAIEAAGTARVSYEGRSVECLDPALTTDGGHLNAIGAQRAGAGLIQCLAAASMRQRGQ